MQVGSQARPLLAPIRFLVRAPHTTYLDLIAERHLIDRILRTLPAPEGSTPSSASRPGLPALRNAKRGFMRIVRVPTLGH
jgi:hypothetical protein